MPPQRIWTINGDFIGVPPSGVGRYAAEVTSALDRLVARQAPLALGVKLILVAPRKPVSKPYEAIDVRIVDEFRRPRLPQFWVQMQLPRFVRGGLISFCNLAPVAVRRQIVCIHDLHTLLMPESYGRGFRLAHKIVLPALGRRVRRITTVSDFSKGHLVAHGIAQEEKVAVSYNGCDHALRWNAANSGLDLGPRPFVLYLGQQQKYKNPELIWRITSRLDLLGIDVYVAGDRGPKVFEQFAPSLPGNLRLLGRISDDEFAAALTNALCLLFPSRMEGFGIPMTEAMALGCPVVASNAACMPEVGGDCVLYSDPDDTQGWVDQIMRLQSDPCFREFYA